MILLATVSLRAADLRLGIVGLDTSHVTAFTEILNDPASRGVPVRRWLRPSKEAARTSSPVESRGRLPKTLQEKYGVKLYDTIEELCRNVDAVLIENVDGRPHLAAAARPVIAARKPLYIDKPMAASVADVREIFRLAAAANVLFSVRRRSGLPATRSRCGRVPSAR